MQRSHLSQKNNHDVRKAMKKHVALALIVLFISTAIGVAAEPHPLVGTWKKIAGRESKDGEWRNFPSEVTMLKHITGTHISWTIFRNDSKEIIAAMGGSVSIDGDKYTENVEHGLGSVMELLGKKQEFTWKIESDKFTQAGTLSNGVYIEERFERVPPVK
jgi:hypothetical protein